jgi:hypothetical protein
MKEVWIGLIGVVPTKGNESLDGAKGAYVNALAPAKSQDEYDRVVRKAVGKLNLFFFECDEVEPLAARAARMALDERLHDLADQALRTQEVMFDEFHCFKNLDG